MELFDKLGYLKTRELWELMANLGIPYCDVVDDEKENLETGEKVTIPRFIPRTDYDGMKSDIALKLQEMNREGRRPIVKRIDKIIKNRINQNISEDSDVNGKSI